MKKLLEIKVHENIRCNVKIYFTPEYNHLVIGDQEIILDTKKRYIFNSDLYSIDLVEE